MVFKKIYQQTGANQLFCYREIFNENQCAGCDKKPKNRKPLLEKTVKLTVLFIVFQYLVNQFSFKCFAKFWILDSSNFILYYVITSDYEKIKYYLICTQIVRGILGENAEVVKLLVSKFLVFNNSNIHIDHLSIEKNHDESNTNKSETEEETSFEDIEVAEPDPN